MNGIYPAYWHEVDLHLTTQSVRVYSRLSEREMDPASLGKITYEGLLPFSPVVRATYVSREAEFPQEILEQMTAELIRVLPEHIAGLQKFLTNSQQVLTEKMRVLPKIQDTMMVQSGEYTTEYRPNKP